MLCFVSHFALVVGLNVVEQQCDAVVNRCLSKLNAIQC